MIATNSTVINTSALTLQLWRNEVTRTIADRLSFWLSLTGCPLTAKIFRFVSDNDKEWFNTELLRLIDSNMGQESLAIAKETKMFVDFMRDAPEPTGEEEGDGETELPKIYEPVESIKILTERLHFFLEQYNDIMRGSSMDLVFFEDAIGHLVKIARALRNPGGNIMLV